MEDIIYNGEKVGVINVEWQSMTEKEKRKMEKQWARELKTDKGIVGNIKEIFTRERMFMLVVKSSAIVLTASAIVQTVYYVMTYYCK